MLKTVLYAIIIFVAGFLSGMLWQTHRLRADGWQAPRQSHLIRVLSHDLKLTPEQELEMEAIIEDARERTRLIHLDISPDLAQIRAESLDAIEDVLTPEQYKQFNQLRSKSTPTPAR